MSVFEMYHKLEAPIDRPIRLCPVCGCKGEVWQFQAKPDAPASKSVMCSNLNGLGPNKTLDGCLLHMPPEEFYQATIREAVIYWNAIADSLVEMREANALKAE